MMQKIMVLEIIEGKQGDLLVEAPKGQNIRTYSY
jgi:hypothetical protein